MIGIDEVGRGSWAGPLLVVAARNTGELPAGLKDSKLLTKKRRESLYFDIELSCDLGEGWVTPVEIDEIGLTKAMELAVDRALTALDAHLEEEIIMDGAINYCHAKFLNARAVVKADNEFPIVSAASIYAKVKRDQQMTELAEQFPQYGFEKHVGYGTAVHVAALKEFGITELHRRSYKPVQVYL